MQDQRISPFFQSLNQSIDSIVPLAMEKFKLDQGAQQWKERLAEATRAHNMDLGKTLYSTYMQTGDKNTLAQAQTLLANASGVPGFQLGESLAPDTQTKMDKAARLKAFTDKVRGGTPVDLEKYNTPGWTPEQLDAGMRAFEPEEVLNQYAAEFPENIKDVITMQHQLKSDDLNDLYKKSLIDYHNTLGEAARTRADKTGEGGGGPTAAIKNYEYFSKIYGPEFAEKLVTKTKDPSEAKVWHDTYQKSLGNFEAPALAEKKADGAMLQYRQKFGSSGGKGSKNNDPLGLR